MLNLRYHLSDKSKVRAGLCEEGRYIRIESRGTVVVLLMNEELAAAIKKDLP